MDKWLMYGLDKQTMRWTENWMNVWVQRVMISGTKPSWKLVTISVPCWSVLGPVLFIIFINDLYEGAECTSSKLADDTKMGQLPDDPECCAVTQRDLNRLEKCMDWNHMKVSKKKFKVLHLGRNNPMYQCILGVVSWKAVWQKKPWMF